MIMYLISLILLIQFSLLESQFQTRTHAITLMEPDRMTPTSVAGTVNVYDDVFINAYSFCKELNKVTKIKEPSYITRCMVPLMQTLRINTSQLLWNEIRGYGEPVIYDMLYGYERSAYYTEDNPATVCMFGAPTVQTVLPILASHVVRKIMVFLPTQFVNQLMEDINDPVFITLIQSFSKPIELFTDEMLIANPSNAQFHHGCDIIHIQPTYTLATEFFRDLLNFLLSNTFPMEAHRIIWMKDDYLDNSTELAPEFYAYHSILQPVLTSSWKYFAGFAERIDSSGFHARTYDRCPECVQLLTTVYIGFVKEENCFETALLQSTSTVHTNGGEQLTDVKQIINNPNIIQYLYHYHPNPYPVSLFLTHSLSDVDKLPSHYHNIILISYTIRVFADTAYGLYEALHHAGYTQVYIVHDMTLFTLESIVIHHCKELFSEGFQRQYGETGMEDRWYCEGLLEEEDEGDEGFGGKKNQKQRRQRQRQRKVKRIPTESMLQIALGAHDVTMFLPHYIVYHMEQLWSDIAFGHYKEQYYTVLRNAVSIWTFSSLHRDYLELEGFAGKVHTLFLYSNHSIEIDKQSTGNIFTIESEQFIADEENVVQINFFGSCSPRRIKTLYYMEAEIEAYNLAVHKKLDNPQVVLNETDYPVTDEHVYYAKLNAVCGGWKELLFDFNLDSYLSGAHILLNLHNEQVYAKQHVSNVEIAVHAEAFRTNKKMKNQRQSSETVEATEDGAPVTAADDEDAMKPTEQHSKFHGNVLEVHRINYLLQLDKFIISEQGNDEYLQHQYTEMVELVSSIDEMIEKIIYFANHGEERRARVKKQREIYARWNKNVTVLQTIMDNTWKNLLSD